MFNHFCTFSKTEHSGEAVEQEFGGISHSFLFFERFAQSVWVLGKRS